MSEQPGLVVLFGSGETSASGRKVHDWVFGRLTPPIRVAVLETPAAFQPNSGQVAEQLAEFVRLHLQNYKPQVTVVPARKRGTPFSPDHRTSWLLFCTPTSSSGGQAARSMPFANCSIAWPGT